MKPLLLLSLFLLPASLLADPVKIACVGDSITYGAGADKGWAYPAQLGRILGPGYDVRNFGVSGATLLRHGDKPYEKQPALQAALQYKPDIVILMLGTNDSKPWNWNLYHGAFESDYRWLTGQLQSANPAEKLYLCRPVWVSGTNRYQIREEQVQMEIPIIDKIAADLHAPEIDMHAALKDHADMLPDTVHPNNAGATLMARAAYAAVKGADYTGPIPPP